MGTYCSSVDAADHDHVAESTKGLHRHATKLVKRPHYHRPGEPITDNKDSGLYTLETNNNRHPNTNNPSHNNSNSNNNQNSSSSSSSSSNNNKNNNSNSNSSKMEDSDLHRYDLVDGQNRAIKNRRIDDRIPETDVSKLNHMHFSKDCDPSDKSQVKMRVAGLMESKAGLLAREHCLAFDAVAEQLGTETESKATRIVREVVKRDLEVYARQPKRTGYGGQEHPRFFGDHFLSNYPIIEQTDLYKISHRMPKGAHLHIHFNANLPPDVLLDIAKPMSRMYICSNIPLVPFGSDPESADYYINFDRCRIQFSIIKAGEENVRSLFDEAYPAKEENKPQKWWMRFQDFLEQFPDKYQPKDQAGCDVDTWLQKKLVFDEEEAHNMLQTSDGAWDKFNARTQMMKGLFNYETAYRTYIRKCLEEFVNDNIQYAEIRPNFMHTNQVFRDDGDGKLDNWAIMDMIIEEYERFQDSIQEHNRKHPRRPKYFGGLKVIYCCPRSFPASLVAKALQECLEFKLKLPEWIAGFDLVGEESKGHPLDYFLAEFVEFQMNCAIEGVEIPFLFHCGETLDIGTEVDENLATALVLKAKRIGHGDALARHPHLMEQLKRANVCLELCPISNEVLGLTPRVSGHAMYTLLANDVHCTISTDNGTFFRSRLSHDFYQLFAGKANMSLFGWRQLIVWSIEHSCMEDDLKQKVYSHWKKEWEVFCKWIIATYGDLDPEEE